MHHAVCFSDISVRIPSQQLKAEVTKTMTLFFPSNLSLLAPFFHLHHRHAVGHCGLHSALTLLFIYVPMQYLNLYPCNVLKVSAFQTNRLCPACPSLW